MISAGKNELVRLRRLNPLFRGLLEFEQIMRSGNHRRSTGFYIWRTYDQKEIDLIEEREGMSAGGRIQPVRWLI
jgi:hypothetical protein